MFDAVLIDEYRCAPEGHTILVFPKGQRVTGKVAEWAVRDGFASRPRGRKPGHTKPAKFDEVK